MSEKTFAEYYKENLCQLPYGSQFRIFKGKTESGKFIQINDRIRDAKTLQKYLVKYDLRDVWVSCSMFLEPKLTGKKIKNLEKNKYWKLKSEGRKTISGCFLKGDFVLDFDKVEFAEVENAYKILKTLKLEKFMFVATSRGWQLWCYDFYDKFCTKKIEIPGERENYCKQKKEWILTILKNSKVKYDPKAVDTRTIYRVYGSLHHDGTICYATDNIKDPKLKIKDRFLSLDGVDTRLSSQIHAEPKGDELFASAKTNSLPLETEKEVALTTSSGERRTLSRGFNYKENCDCFGMHDRDCKANAVIIGCE